MKGGGPSNSISSWLSAWQIKGGSPSNSISSWLSAWQMKGVFLALETSTDKGSVGVFRKTGARAETLAFREWLAGGQLKQKKASHSSKLPLEIQEALKEAALKPADLEFLSAGAGPGRWTGVRTAANTVRALAFALDRPVCAADSLQIAAEPFLSERRMVPVAWNGFKNTVYFGEYSRRNPRKAGAGGAPSRSPGSRDEKPPLPAGPAALPFPEWLKLMEGRDFCVGDVEDFYELPPSLRQSCRFQKSLPCAKSLARLVCREFQSQRLVPWRLFQPLYLRGPA